MINDIDNAGKAGQTNTANLPTNITPANIA